MEDTERKMGIGERKCEQPKLEENKKLWNTRGRNTNHGRNITIKDEAINHVTLIYIQEKS